MAPAGLLLAEPVSDERHEIIEHGLVDAADLVVGMADPGRGELGLLQGHWRGERQEHPPPWPGWPIAERASSRRRSRPSASNVGLGAGAETPE